MGALRRCMRKDCTQDRNSTRQASVPLVVDFLGSFDNAYDARGGTSGYTSPFKATGRGSEERLSQEDDLYDSRGAFGLLKFR
jgi:hypothetical protein